MSVPKRVTEMARKLVVEERVRIYGVGIPLELDTAFVDAFLGAGFQKREALMLGMCFVIKKLGKKVPSFKDKAYIWAKYNSIKKDKK